MKKEIKPNNSYLGNMGLLEQVKVRFSTEFPNLSRVELNNRSQSMLDSMTDKGLPKADRDVLQQTVSEYSNHQFILDTGLFTNPKERVATAKLILNNARLVEGRTLLLEHVLEAMAEKGYSSDDILQNLSDNTATIISRAARQYSDFASTQNALSTSTELTQLRIHEVAEDHSLQSRIDKALKELEGNKSIIVAREMYDTVAIPIRNEIAQVTEHFLYS